VIGVALFCLAGAAGAGCSEDEGERADSARNVPDAGRSDAAPKARGGDGPGGGLVGVVSSPAPADLTTGAVTGVGTFASLGPLGAAIAGARIVDLSHAYDPDTIYWPTADGFVFERVFAGKTDKGYWYEANNFSTAEHGGTHLDAPVHFAAGHQTVEQISLDRLIGPGIVVDVSDHALANDAGRDYQITVEDFEAWEQESGRRIEPGTIVLLMTGFGQWWRDRVRYMGTDERGEAGVAKLRFPGLHPDAAVWLISQRRIAAVGLDTPSIDYGRSEMFASHRTLFAANVPVFENVAGLGQLPADGFLVVALPMKIKGGSGAPLRAVAIVPRGGAG